MNIEIPDFLLKMSSDMKNQNIRCTSDCIYQVKQTQHLVTAEGYNESHWVLCDDNGEFYRSDTDDDDVALEYLTEHYDDTCIKWSLNDSYDEIDNPIEYFHNVFSLSDIEDFHADIAKVFVQEVDVVLYTCFTEQEALEIAAKYHESAQVFTYGISLYQNNETKQLRDWILSLTE